MTTRLHIESLHKLYGQLTGLVIPLDMQRESMWYEWQRRGHGEQELREVVAHLQRGIREQRRNVGALKFRNLIGSPDYFEEDLAEARASRRAHAAKPAAPRASVLAATGRPAAPQGKAKSVEEIVSSEGFKKFSEFRKSIQ